MQAPGPSLEDMDVRNASRRNGFLFGSFLVVHPSKKQVTRSQSE